jgi:hypothetical protein
MKKNQKHRLTGEASTVHPTTKGSQFLSLEEQKAFLHSMAPGSSTKPNETLPALISQEEEVLLLRALARTSPNGGFTEAEGGRVWQWAEEVRLADALLHLVLKGWMDIELRDDGQLVFRAVDPKVILAELERQRGEQIDSADFGNVQECPDQEPPDETRKTSIIT